MLKHIWKPLFHEIAAGTFMKYHDELDYINFAYRKGFKFLLGEIRAINQQEKWILLKSDFNSSLQSMSNEQRIYYDILVLAIGSQVNDFNVPGVKKKYCLLLDTVSQAESCHLSLLNYIIPSIQGLINRISISIVGAGATGIELAAELSHVLTEARKYTNNTSASIFDFQLNVIEASDRILSMMPRRISQSVNHYMKINSINVITNTRITKVDKNELITDNNEFINSDITIWAAGVKSNGESIDHELEVNKINQFIVKPTLQTTKDNAIFSMGDCASCPQIDKNGNTYFVPPRAQAAHQQAKFLTKAISCYLANSPLPIYKYSDYGSLISLSRYNVVGNLMSKVAKSLYIEGAFARFAYWLLYKKHLLVLQGLKYVVLSTIADIFMKRQRPEIKLH